MGTECAFCDAPLPPGATTCPRCARPVLQRATSGVLELAEIAPPSPAPAPGAAPQATCPACGHPVVEGRVDCLKCGVILAKARAPRPAEPPAPEPAFVAPVPRPMFEETVPGSPEAKELRLYLVEWGALSLALTWGARTHQHLSVILGAGTLLGVFWALAIARRWVWASVQQHGSMGLLLLLVLCGWNWVFLALIASGVSFVNRLVHDLLPRAFAWTPVAVTTAVLLATTAAIGSRMAPERRPPPAAELAAEPAEEDPRAAPEPAAASPAPPHQPATVALRVESVPQGAAIAVDGEPTGKGTPAELRLQDTKGHDLKLDLAGYLPAQQRLSAPWPPQVVVVLSPLPLRLHVETEPAGADVAVDGAPVGKSPGDFDLPPGRRVIVASKEGFVPVRAEHVLSEESRTWTAKLQAAAMLKVACNVEGAEIFVDGASTGQRTPAGPIAVAPGARTVEARLEELTSGKKRFKAVKGKTAKVSLSIVDWAKKRRDEKRRRLEAEKARLEAVVEKADSASSIFVEDHRLGAKIGAARKRIEVIDAELIALDEQEGAAGP